MNPCSEYKACDRRSSVRDFRDSRKFRPLHGELELYANSRVEDGKGGTKDHMVHLAFPGLGY